MRFSYWEAASFLSNIDDLVIGGGIVGISAALELKKNNPERNVVVVERDPFSAGASTKNAGFACFGSASELIDDLESMPEEEVFNLVKRRYSGLLNLQNLLGKESIDYLPCGGIELFRNGDEELFDQCLSKLDYLNDQLEKTLGFRPYSKMDVLPNFEGNTKFIGGIFNSHEGSINAGKMMSALIAKAQSVGVRFINGLNILNVTQKINSVAVDWEGYTNEVERVFVCVNGFARTLMPELDVRPARNQVVVTSELTTPIPAGTFHVDKGYIYFRPIENRLLIGGFRNTDLINEETAEFGLTETVQNNIKQFIDDYLLPASSYSLEYKWSGILGLGPTKTTIVKKHSNNIFIGVRMGGMGVAIGTLVGKELAELAAV
jgi:glycine/D-amino acid oxidase-like deaminating enzyme